MRSNKEQLALILEKQKSALLLRQKRRQYMATALMLVLCIATLVLIVVFLRSPSDVGEGNESISGALMNDAENMDAAPSADNFSSNNNDGYGAPEDGDFNDATAELPLEDENTLGAGNMGDGAFSEPEQDREPNINLESSELLPDDSSDPNGNDPPLLQESETQESQTPSVGLDSELPPIELESRPDISEAPSEEINSEEATAESEDEAPPTESDGQSDISEAPSEKVDSEEVPVESEEGLPPAESESQPDISEAPPVDTDSEAPPDLTESNVIGDVSGNDFPPYEGDLPEVPLEENSEDIVEEWSEDAPTGEQSDEEFPDWPTCDPPSEDSEGSEGNVPSFGDIAKLYDKVYRVDENALTDSFKARVSAMKSEFYYLYGIDHLGPAMLWKMHNNGEGMYYHVILYLPEGGGITAFDQKLALGTGISTDTLAGCDIPYRLLSDDMCYCTLTMGKIQRFAINGVYCYYVGTGLGNDEAIDLSTEEGLEAYCDLYGDLFVSEMPTLY